MLFQGQRNRADARRPRQDSSDDDVTKDDFAGPLFTRKKPKIDCLHGFKAVTDLDKKLLLGMIPNTTLSHR